MLNMYCKYFFELIIDGELVFFYDRNIENNSFMAEPLP